MSAPPIIASVATFAGVTVVVKAGVLSLCAILLVYLSRRTSSASRHAMWVMLFSTLALLPLLAPVTPRVALTIPASIQWRALAGRPIEADPGRAAAYAGAARESREYRQLQAAPARSRAISWLDMLGFIYLLGCGAHLVRLGVHYRMARDLVRGGYALRGAPRDAVRACQQGGLLLCNARIVLSPDVSGPCVIGPFRPVLALPVDAMAWSERRLRAALIHEAAHVQRRDPMVQLLISLVCAVYWPNPLVWLAAQRQRREQERACDDRAILAGIASDEYAQHLVDVARDALVRRRLVAGLPIASGPLSERIRAIMDPHAERHRISPVRLFVAVVVFSVLVVPVAAVELHSRAVVRETGRRQDPDIRALADPDPAVRARAAWSLGERELTGAVAPLMERLRDEDAAVQTMAAWALGEIKDASAVDALIHALDTDDDPIVRELAAVALGEIRDPRAVASLSVALRGEDGVRSAASWALQRMVRQGDALEPAIRQLMASIFPWPDLDNEVPPSMRSEYRLPTGHALRALNSVDPMTRARATSSLGIQADTGAVMALIERVRDTDPTVRAAAVWALDEINPSRRTRRQN